MSLCRCASDAVLGHLIEHGKDGTVQRVWSTSDDLQSWVRACFLMSHSAEFASLKGSMGEAYADAGTVQRFWKAVLTDEVNAGWNVMNTLAAESLPDCYDRLKEAVAKVLPADRFYKA